jgi:hypothetical protein
MRWAALYRRPPILRRVSASQIHADHATNRAWMNALLPTLRTALADNTVSIIACQVEHSQNMKLTDEVGESEFVVDPGK